MSQKNIRFKNFNWGFLFALAINYSWLLFLCTAFVETAAVGAVLALAVLAGLYLLALTPFVDWYYRWIIKARKPDGIESERIQRIWGKICENAAGKGIRVPGNIEFFVSDVEGINAYAAGSRTIVVHRDLLANYMYDDEIGGVLAHELAHHINGDTAALMMSLQGTLAISVIRWVYMAFCWCFGAFMGLVFGIMFSDGNVENGFGIFRLTKYLFSLIGKVFDFFLAMIALIETIGIRFFGRKSEFAADRLSTLIGFGNGLIDTFHKFPHEQKINKLSMEYILYSTHPPTDERIAAVEMTMQEMQNTGNDGKTQVQDNRDNEDREEKSYSPSELYEMGTYCVNHERITEGLNMLMQSAAEGEPKAYTELGRCYLEGIGVEVDKKKAAAYLKKTIPYNEPEGIYLLAECYSSIKRNPEFGTVSVRLYDKAARLGFVEAKAKLGICYLEGKGTERNEQAAFQYLYEAVEANCYHTAGYPLAKCYIYGIGTDTDIEAGLKLLKLAIEAGCDDFEEAKALFAKKR